jgi:hypothetical protein
MINVEYNGSTVEIDGHRIELDEPIKKTVVHQDNAYVLLDHTDLSPSNRNQNIIALDADGSRLWQVDASPASDDQNNPFTGISMHGGQLIGFTWKGISVEINHDTGAWENPTLSK